MQIDSVGSSGNLERYPWQPHLEVKTIYYPPFSVVLYTWRIAKCSIFKPAIFYEDFNKIININIFSKKNDSTLPWSTKSVPYYWFYSFISLRKTTYFLLWTKMAITYLGNAEGVSAYKKILSSILFE